MNSLDFYAKIEPLFGFYEEYDKLYSLYIKTITPFKPQNILDIGSGNGHLLKRLAKEGFVAEGIERSKEMVKRAQALNVQATCKELSDLGTSSFDCALAVGDVLNYMNKSELNNFFLELSRVIKDNGYFVADINTLMGFELADGLMSNENETQFLTVDAAFSQKELKTDFTLFEKQGELYKKSSHSILQYYHSLDFFKNLQDFSLIDLNPVSMFSDEDEKALMVFQKQAT